MIKSSGIYKITSPSGRFYVGQSDNIERRFKSYKRMNCKSQPKLYNSFLKYGVKNHKFELITECSIDELNDLERYYQELFNSVKNGLNCIYQATNSKRRVLSDEVKFKISNSQKGKFVSEETRKKQSEARKSMIGIKNPQSIKIRCFNTKTKQVLIMAVYETARYFKVDWELIYNRCRYEYVSPRKLAEWDFSYLDNPIKKELKLGQNKPILDLNTGVYYYGVLDFLQFNKENKYFKETSRFVRL